jgi:hypothetical protein
LSYVFGLLHKSLLHVAVVVVEVFLQQKIVRISELLDFFLGHDHQHGCQHLRAVGVHEQLLPDLIFVHQVPQVFLEEGRAVFLDQGCQLVLDFVLLLQQLFQAVVATFLSRLNARNQYLEGLISLELD